MYLALPLVALLIACPTTKTDTGAEPFENTPPRTAILSPVDGATLRAGEILALTAQIGDAETAPENLAVTWTSSADGILAGTPTLAGGTDCDDTDAAIHPGATETCDGEDNDCDGEIEDAIPQSGTTTPAPWAVRAT